MLVFTRKPGQAFIVGTNVRIKVIRVAGNRVRIGIEAPPETPVIRQELLPQLAAATQTKEPVSTP